jgi:hypothetical protein
MFAIIIRIFILISLFAINIQLLLFAQQQKIDDFAKIAVQQHPDPDRIRLTELKPEILPPFTVESEYSNPLLSIPEYQTPDRSFAYFNKQLSELYNQYKPFLNDYTPHKHITRSQIIFDEMNFRFETDNDLLNFEQLLKGNGEWEKVCIPHYVGKVGWWRGYYQKKFHLNNDIKKHDRYVLCFRGVDYKCDVYVNNRMVKQHEGFFAPFEVDITPYINCDDENTLTIILYNESTQTGIRDHLNNFTPDGDKLYAVAGIGWDDPYFGWHTCPPGAGIWQSVYLEGRSDLFITDIYIRPDIDQKYIEVKVEVNNPYTIPQPINLWLSVYSKNFKSKPLEHIAVKTKPAGHGKSEYSYIVYLDQFRLWTPNQPFLYTLRVKLENTLGEELDVADQSFGMRKFILDTLHIPKGSFYLNNEPIILRGANSMGNFEHALMKGRDALIKDILIAKLANLNFIRMTQRVVPAEIYDLCDQLGIMTQSDLPLFGYLRRTQVAEAIRQTIEMTKIIRSHPCNIIVTFINEPNENKPGIRSHRFLSREELHHFYQAASNIVHIYHPDQIIKPADGELDPPSWGLPDNHVYNTWYGSHSIPIGKLIKGYWVGNKTGWNYTCGEYGAEGLDNRATMYQHYPSSWLPSNEDSVWNPDKISMAQTWSIQPLWYDTQDNINTWINASQKHQSWAIRTFTRALRRQSNRIISSSIHLLIDAWPAGWMKAVVDVDRTPKPAYWELKDALQPVMVDIKTDQLRYFSNEKTNIEFYVCNDYPTLKSQHRIYWEVRDQNNVSIFKQSQIIHEIRFGSTFIGKFKYLLPTVQKRQQYTIRLLLTNATGISIHQTIVPIEIFPIKLPVLLDNQIKIGVLGNENGRAWNLIKELGYKPILFNLDSITYSTIVVDQVESYIAIQSLLNNYVAKGGKVIFLSQISGSSWKVDSTTITIRKLSNNLSPSNRFFLSRKTGHPIVNNNLESDFFLWFNKKADHIDALTTTWIDAKGLQPVLTTGLWDWNTPPRIIVPVAATLRQNNGLWIINQLSTEEWIAKEPMTFLYFKNILDYCLYFH